MALPMQDLPALTVEKLNKAPHYGSIRHMRHMIWILSLWMAVALFSSARAELAANPLLDELWKHRPLIISVPDAHHPMLAALRQKLSEPAIRAEFDTRKMVYYEVTGGLASREGEALRHDQNTALLQALRLNPADGATALLIGLDGGIKLQTGSTPDLQAVFELIDGMPMRRWQRD